MMDLFEYWQQWVKGQSGPGQFSLQVNFGSGSDRSWLECEWTDPHHGQFRAAGNAHATFSVAELMRFETEVLA